MPYFRHCLRVNLWVLGFIIGFLKEPPLVKKQTLVKPLLVVLKKRFTKEVDVVE